MTGVLQSNVYLEDFSEFARAQNAQPWLRRLQEHAIERFSELGFPTTHDEEWRFTNVAPISRVAFQRARNNAAPRQLPHADDEQLVLVNGRYAPELSRLPGGVKAGSLAEAMRADADVVEPYLARYASFQTHAF